MKSYVDHLSLKNSHDDIILTATTNLYLCLFAAAASIAITDHAP
jgi:hypothetical protein